MATNITREYIDFSKKNIIKYLKLILDKYYSRKITDELLDVYIDVRYNNIYELKYNNLESNINYYMKKTAIEMNRDKDEDYIFKVKNVFYLFKYILYFDNVLEYDSLKTLVLEIDEYRNNTLGLYDEMFVDTLSSLVKENEKRKEKYLNSITSNEFVPLFNATNRRKAYLVELNNNIKFNRIYSDYSINKVYNEGIVNEQKTFIIYYLVTKQILENTIKGEIDKEYIVSFPCSILEKEQKLNRLLNIINDDVTKNSLILKVTYADYILHKETINTWIKEGFKVAVIIDDKYNYDEQSKIWLDIFKYIIVDKEKANYFNKSKIIIE